MVSHPQVLPTDTGHPEPLRVEGRIEEGDPAFNATPIVEIPGYTIAVLRSIRVGMLELISHQKIKTFDGYVVVADLVDAMVISFQARQSCVSTTSSKWSTVTGASFSTSAMHVVPWQSKTRHPLPPLSLLLTEEHELYRRNRYIFAVHWC